jgi:hydroxymethylpyrimidine pyrophosphatase-like HAD family hydrolase
VQVRIIISGAGSHRYVDCVPEAAGKERSLQYVRQQYAIPEHLCVASGDSGNDILMLEGDHPGIVVGNAQPELLHWLVKQPQTGKVVYTDACLADGIMEGLARHGLY